MDIPQNLAELSDDDLAALSQRLPSAISAAAASGDADGTTQLADALDDLNTEITRRRDVAALEDRISTNVTTAVLSILDERLPAPAEALEDDEAPVEAPVEEAPAEAEDSAPEVEDPEAEPAEELATVVPAELAANDPIPEPATEARPSNLVTALRSGSIERDQNIPDLNALAVAMHEAARGLGEGVSRRVAHVELNHFDAELTENPVDNIDIIEGLTRRHDTAEALVASGGWCAPSEIRYDFFGVEAVDGILDLPEVRVSRGGLKYPTSPSARDATQSTAQFVWTETADEAADPDTSSTWKTSWKLPCVSFSETRLDEHVLHATHGNLSDRAYPELTARYTRLLMVANEHAINARFLAAVASGSTAQNLTSSLEKGGVSAYLPDAAALVADQMRNRYLTRRDQLVEVVLPFWVLNGFRGDWARRAGGVDASQLAAADAAFIAAFTARNIRPQFVMDWQDMSGSSWKQLTWPATVKFLAYFPGTWVRGNGGTLDIGVTRDSVQNRTNDHTLMFTEQALSLMQIGHESRLVTTAFNTSGLASCCNATES